MDDCTRFRVLRLYRHLNHLKQFGVPSPGTRGHAIPIRKLQCDNGSEFSLEFALSVQEAGIRHRYITPRRPEQNGKVERSHLIDDEEFWQRHSFSSFDDAAVALEGSERRYNQDRFWMALCGHTPSEVLAAKLAATEADPQSSTGVRS